MSFVYPLGLLGLIGIPILIIIYIIKNKYTEQTIASTYIWKLSERFLKKKKPISKLQGLISLILQCLIVFAISMLIAKPSIVIKGAANDYCFILDASASMDKVENGITRFDSAKSKIESIINDSKNGSTYTLITSGSDTSTVYEASSSKSRSIELLNQLTCSSVSNTLDDALNLTQSYFDNNKSLKVYLVTDKNYTVTNMELINVSESNLDFAILSSTYKLTEATYLDDGRVDSPAKLEVSGLVTSYFESKEIEMELLVNNSSVETIKINVEKGVNSTYNFSVERNAFDNYEVRINESDNLDLDSHYFVYNLVAEHNYKALIVSERPFYFEALLESYSKIDSYDAITISTYESGSFTGYGLYIFDTSSFPTTLPTDGTIWLFNPKQSIESSGFSWNDSITSESGFTLEKETVYGDEKSFLEGYIDSSDYALTCQNYNKYTVSRNFKTLFSISGNPVIFVGSTTNKAKNREIVFGFDIRESNMAMNYNGLLLLRKMLDYSFPQALDKNENVSGTEFSYNLISGTKNIRLLSPSGTQTYLDMSNSVGTIELNEVGTYTITYNLDNGESKEFKVYNAYPESENEEETNLSATLIGTLEYNYTSAKYSLTTILAVLLVLCFIADWMVYCYEQHQLF